MISGSSLGFLGFISRLLKMKKKENLHKIYTTASLYRTVHVSNCNAPLDSLDIHLTSCYRHNLELFPEPNDFCRQVHTVEKEMVQNKDQQEMADVPSHHIIFGGISTRPSIHSVKLGIGSNHISQTNSGYSRKVDGSFYNL